MIKQKTIFYSILFCAAIAAIILYNPSLLYFQNDDMVHIPLSRDGILLQHNSFRPICDLSMMLDYKLWGKNAFGYHLTNLLLNIINAILVFLLSKNMLKKYAPDLSTKMVSATVTVLFWIYMNHSEGVFWILGRSAMLGMIFFLPACIFYLKRESNICLFYSILFSFLAWLSYESTYILPLIFLLISYTEITNKKHKRKQEFRRLIIMFIAFIFFLFTRFYFTGTLSTEYETGNLNNGGVTMLMGNFFRLAIRSWLPPSQNASLLVVEFISLIFLISILIARLKNSHQRKILFTLILMWLISLLPYVTLGIDTKGVESERFIYLPSFFVCCIIAFIIFSYNFLWRIVALTIVCTINIVLLSYHAKQYRFAGSIVRTTIEAVNSLKNKNLMYAENIPQENFGALIFRSGFNEGVAWLKNSNTVDSVVQLSQSHKDLPIQDKYLVKYSNNISIIKDAVIRNKIINGDTYFLYTDSVLYVINK